MSDQAAPSAEPSSGSAEQLKAGHAPASEAKSTASPSIDLSLSLSLFSN